MYNDTYVELLVKRQTTIMGKIGKVVVILLTVLFAIAGLTAIPLALIPAVIMGVLSYFVTLNTDLEFEYLYVDKELSIDKVMARTKRKKVATFDLERMEILAPLNSHRLDNYKNREGKVIDYSSGVAAQPEKRYMLVYDGSKKILVEPNEELLKAIRSIAPRKVFMD